MNSFWTLTRNQIKVNSIFSLLKLKWRTKRKEAVFIGIAMAVALVGSIPIYYAFFLLLRYLHRIMAPIGQANVIPLFVIMTAQLLVLILGLFYTMSVFYFSQDLGWLVALPVTPAQLILSKYVSILFNEYLSLLPLLPLLVYFGLISSAGPGYWLMLPLVYLLLPVIPLTIAALLVVGLVRLVNFSRKKDLLIIIGSLLLIVVAFIPQLLASRSGALTQAQVAAFFSRSDSLIQILGRRFPPAKWASLALAFPGQGRGLAGGALFAGCSLALFLVLWLVGKRFYFQGLRGLSETSTRAGRRRTVPCNSFHPRSPVAAIFWREWRIMNRTPMFLLNGVLTTILFPLLFIVMFSFNRRSDNPIFALLSVQNPQLKLLVAAGILLFCGSLNGTAASTFSREGSCFWMSKVIPVRYWQQVLGKFVHVLTISLLGILAGSIFVQMFLKLNPLSLLLAWILAFAGAMALAGIGMTIDLFHPLLDWSSPMKAIKQNINVFASMVLDIGMIFGLGFVAMRLSRSGLTPVWLYLLLLGIILAVGGLAFFLLAKTTQRSYARIEK